MVKQCIFVLYIINKFVYAKKQANILYTIVMHVQVSAKILIVVDEILNERKREGTPT